ncbi:MAG: hypothetical protein J6R33_01065 [Clostridia bacterium]|nr:hypothetical protein [Clostridia bacterium]
MDYEKIIDELIEKKLQAALAELDKKREQTTAAYAQKKETAKAEREDLTRGAYADYAKNIDPGGIEAEKMAARGLSDSGKTETAKVGYYNVYQNMLTAIRNKTDEELQNLSEQEQKALTALDEADTKARDNAYTLLMEENIRRQEAAAKKAEADRQYQLKLAAQAAKKTSTAKTEVVGYPVNGTEKEKYKWLEKQLKSLAWSVMPGEDNPRNRILAQSQKYLDLAYRDLDTDSYSKLLNIVV